MRYYWYIIRCWLRWEYDTHIMVMLAIKQAKLSLNKNIQDVTTMTQPNKISTLLYFEWSPPWHFKPYLLTYYSDILPNILSDIYSDILSAILSGFLSGIYSGILSGILFGIYCVILSYLWVEMQTTYSYLQILVMSDFFHGLDPPDVTLFFECFRCVLPI